MERFPPRSTLAARAAQIDRMILHAGDTAGVKDAQSGLAIAENIAATCGPHSSLSALVDHCVQLKLQWGVSDDARTVAIPNFDQDTVLIQRGSPLEDACVVQQQDVRNCAVSPKGEWIATGSHTTADGFGAKIWEAATGHLKMELPVPKQCKPAFSPNGRWLLTNTGGCRLWQVGTWADDGHIADDAQLAACELDDGRTRGG